MFWQGFEKAASGEVGDEEKREMAKLIARRMRRQKDNPSLSPRSRKALDKRLNK